MMSRSGLALAIALGLAACSGDDVWFGAAEDPPLPGERVSVMLLERELSADPNLADLPVELPPPVQNDSWPQNGGVATHAMHHLAANGPLDLAWRTDIGAGSADSGQVLARPVIAEGRVFTMDAEGTIHAFDADGGAPIWTFTQEEEDGVIGGGLAYANGWLFATLSSGEVIGLDATTGAVMWRQPLGSPLRAAPTIAEDRVLVLSADNQLYALDGTTGRPVWRHSGFLEGAALLGGPSPAVDRGLVIVPYSSAEVYALRLDSGRPLWSDTVERPRRTQALDEITDIEAMPVIEGDTVYVAGYGGQMAAIDARRGIRAWDLDVASTDTPWLAGDFIYVLTTRGEVVCLLRESGRVRWVSPLPRFNNPDDPGSTAIVWTGPILVGDRLLIVGSNGQAVTMSPYNGEILGRQDLPGPVAVAPVAALGNVYMVTEDAELLAYR
jgi:outer membrane protein assembly factor BamB